MLKSMTVIASLLLSSSDLFAASRVWISEYQSSRPAAIAPFAQLPAVVQQPAIDISGGTSKRSLIFSSLTRYIRIVCEVQCAFSTTTPATSDSTLLPALRPEYFGVTAGGAINVIAVP